MFIGFGLLIAALHTTGIILLLFIPIFLVFSVITALGANIVIIEDDFGVGLGNIFRVGMKYFFNYLGALLLGILPGFAISGIIAAVMFNNVNQMSATPMNSATDIYGGLGWVYWLMVAIMVIYNIIYMSFIMTYGSHSYIAYRNTANTAIENESNQTDTSEISSATETEILSETDTITEDNNIEETTGENND